VRRLKRAGEVVMNPPPHPAPNECRAASADRRSPGSSRPRRRRSKRPAHCSPGTGRRPLGLSGRVELGGRF
jgi:hypothetical protein